jgi:hypothetical protein
MSDRVRQLLWTAALAAPVVYAVFAAPPLVSDVRAQGPMRMLGPNFPIRVDASGDSQPGAGDESITMPRSGNTITVNSRWSACAPGNTSNQITLSNPSGGRFQTMTRVNNDLTQSITAQATSGGAVSAFSYAQVDARNGSSRTGTISLLDQNGNGVVDLLMVSGALSASASFSYHGSSDYISIPWAQASALGARSDGCGGSVQLFVPLADTNGDGAGDTVVLDLDGNGVADPEFFTSPPIAAPAVPSMGVAARAVLIALIGMMGAWFLSRSTPRQLTRQRH